METNDYREFFDKPVAVQLKSPSLLIDNDGEPRNRVEHDGKTYGVPQVVANAQGQMAVNAVLVGVMTVAESGKMLLLRSKGDHGAVIVTTLLPEQIQHVFLVTKPGEGMPMIARPGN